MWKHWRQTQDFWFLKFLDIKLLNGVANPSLEREKGNTPFSFGIQVYTYKPMAMEHYIAEPPSGGTLKLSEYMGQPGWW